MQNYKGSKTISIPLFVIILIVMIITTLVLSIKTICYSNNEEIIEEKNIEDNINDIKAESESIIDTKQDVAEIKEDDIQEDNIQENIEKQENKKVETYTAQNGQIYESIGIINIPSLNIKYPILSTTSEKLLKVSVTKYWGGNPNEVGNLCISGHNYKNSKFFGNLQKIKNGDIIQITDLEGKTLDYKVYDTYVVEPEDTACTSQLTNGKIEVTLITCYYENGNVHATKRFIVKARVE